MRPTKSLLVFDNLQNLSVSQELIASRFPTSRFQAIESLGELESVIRCHLRSSLDQPIVVVTDQPAVIELAKRTPCYMPVVMMENAESEIGGVDGPNSDATSSSESANIEFSDNDEFAESIDQAFAIANQFHDLKQRSSNLDALAERERKIIQLAANGVPNKTIAVRLGVSIKTVEKNRRNAYSKLSVSSTAEMASLVTFEKFFGALV